jgi:hypothetical protein
LGNSVVSKADRANAPPVNTNGRLRKIDIPEANDGTVLLDSGSTINVSGDSAFFTPKSTLELPLLILLDISKYVASINSFGSLRILAPTGFMEVDDLYYCPGINGSILLTGSLLTSGWQLQLEGTKAWLTNPNGNSFYLNFKNFCWKIKIKHNAMLSKVSQKPSYDTYA